MTLLIRLTWFIKNHHFYVLMSNQWVIGIILFGNAFSLPEKFIFGFLIRQSSIDVQIVTDINFSKQVAMVEIRVM